MLRKIFCVVFSLAFALSVCACASSGNKNKTKDSQDKKTDVTTTASGTEDADKTEDETSSTQSAPAPEKKKITLLYQGDSVTWRDNAPVAYSTYATPIMQKAHPELSIRTVNKGIPGNTVTDLWNRYKTDIYDVQPDVISILIGVNDAVTWRSNISIEEFKQTYETMLTTIKRELPNTKIMIMTPFVVYKNSSRKDDLLENIVAVVGELAEKYADVYFPAHELFAEKEAAGEGKTYSDDGIHPNIEGAKLLGEAYAKAIDPLLK